MVAEQGRHSQEAWSLRVLPHRTLQCDSVLFAELKRPAFSRLVYAFFSIALAILFGAGLLAFRSTLDLISVDKTYVVRSAALTSLEELKSTLLSAVVAERNYLVTGDEANLRHYATARAGLLASLASISSMIGDSSAQQTRLGELRGLLQGKFAALDEMISARRAEGIGRAVRTILVERSMLLLDRIDAVVDELQASEEGLLQGLQNRSIASAYASLGLSEAGGLLAVLLLTFAFVLLEREIIGRRIAEKTLLNARDIAETANREKSEFLANMSHEIRTPMNAVLGFAELLEASVTIGSKQKGYIDGIKAGGKNLLGIINDILDLSKIEAGRLAIRSEPVRLQSVAHDVEQIFSVATAQKRLDFRVDVVTDVPGSLLLDAARLRQVLFNLVGNAVKFTDAGSVTVVLSAMSAGSYSNAVDLTIDVRDTGIGIPEGEQAAIFEPFRQAAPTDRTFGGTGLGLTISRRLVEMMGGVLSVQSEVGKGSCFRVHLPGVRIGSSSPEGIKDQDRFSLESGAEFEDQVILLVEDVESNRQIVRAYLSSERLTLLEAEDGLRGLECAVARHPALILMDLQLPVMNGLEVVRSLRNRPDTRRIPIVALSATMGPDADGIRGLLDGFLRKPVSRHELLEALSRLLAHHRKPVSVPLPPPAVQTISHFIERARQSASLRSGMRSVMRSEILPEYERLTVTLAVRAVREWCARLGESSVTWGCPELGEYARLLRERADGYQVAGIVEGLKAFRPVVEEFT